MDWTQFSGMPAWSYGVGPIGLDPNATFGSMLEPGLIPDPMGLAPNVSGTVGGPTMAPNTGAPGMPGLQQGLKAFQGLAQPKPPDVVKPSTPHQPAIKAIESGQLFELLAKLGMQGGAGAPKMPPINLSQLLR